MAMKKQEMQRLLALLGRLTRGQRQELVSALKAQSNAEASLEVLESGICSRDVAAPGGMPTTLARRAANDLAALVRLQEVRLVHLGHARPRTTWRTTSAGSARWTGCHATLPDRLSCGLWRSAVDDVLS